MRFSELKKRRFWAVALSLAMVTGNMGAAGVYAEEDTSVSAVYQAEESQLQAEDASDETVAQEEAGKADESDQAVASPSESADPDGAVRPEDGADEEDADFEEAADEEEGAASAAGSEEAVGAADEDAAGDAEGDSSQAGAGEGAGTVYDVLDEKMTSGSDDAVMTGRVSNGRYVVTTPAASGVKEEALEEVFAAGEEDSDGDGIYEAAGEEDAQGDAPREKVYNADYPGVPIVPEYYVNDTSFFRNNIRNGSLGLTSRMKVTYTQALKYDSGRSGDVKEGDLGGSDFSMVRSKDGRQCRYILSFDLASDYLQGRMKASELSAHAKANLYPDYHKNYIGHNSTGKARWGLINMKLSVGTKSSSLTSDAQNDEDPQYKSLAVTGNNYWYVTPSVKLDFENTVCQCGNNKIDNIAVALADNEGPSTKKAFVARYSGGKYYEEKNGFRPGETGYIVVDFDEPIRFANNQWNDLSLTLNCVNVKNDQGADAVTAKLISLSGSRLVFKFDVPAQDDINVYFKSAGSNWTNRSGAYDLAFISATGYTLSGITGYKTRSAITDLAGNAVESVYHLGKLDKIYLDGVKPEAAAVKVTSSLESAAADSGQGDASNIYAGPGDTINYSVYFSELITGFDSSKVKAKLNVTRGGSPVELSLSSVGKISGSKARGVDAGKDDLTVFNFTTLEIDEDMDMDNKDPIAITEITGLDSAVDMRENAFLTSSIRNMDQNTGITPTKRFWLDTVAPDAVADAFKAQNSKKYADNPVFAVPILVKDQTGSKAQTQVSGTINLDGQLALEVPALSETESAMIYYYVDSKEAVNDSRWQSIALQNGRADLGSFTQMGETLKSYVHIMLDKNTDYGYDFSDIVEFNCKLTVNCQDHAGNTAQREILVENVKPVDKVDPQVELTGVNYANTGVNEGEITARFKVSDNLKVNDITCRCEETEEEKNSSGVEDELFEFECGKLEGEGTISVNIAAKDYANRSVTATYEIAYNFQVPKPNYSFDGGSRSKPVLYPSLSFTDPETPEGVTGTYHSFIVLEAGGDELYVAGSSTNGAQIFDNNDVRWYKASGSIGGEITGTDNSLTARDVNDLLNKTCGEYNMYLYTVYEGAENNTSAADVKFTAETTKQELTAFLTGYEMIKPDLSFGEVYNVADSGSEDGPKEAYIFTDTSSWDDVEVSDTDFESTYKTWDKDSGFDPVASIGDYAFSISIDPVDEYTDTTNEFYGSNAVESFGYVFQRYFRKTGSNHYEFHDVLGGDLSTDEKDQLISISANAASESGWYRIVLNAKMRDGREYAQPSPNMYIDTRDAGRLTAEIYDYHRSQGGFLIKGHSALAGPEGAQAYNEELAEYMSGARVLKLGASTPETDTGLDDENYFKFNIEGYVGKVEGVTNEYKYRIFSSRDERPAAEREELWQPLPYNARVHSNDELRNKYDTAIHVTVSDNITGSDYDITKSGGKTETVNNLPLAEGANIVIIQVRNNAGRVYDLGSFKVNVSTHAPQMSMESEKINGSRNLPIRQEVWPVYPDSEAGYELSCYAGDGYSTPVSRSNTYALTEAGDTATFYALNEYGNVSRVDFTADDDVDGEAPDFVCTQSHMSTGYEDRTYDYDSYNNSQEEYSNPLGFHFYVYSGGSGDKNLDASQFYITYDREYSKLLTGEDKPLTFNIPVGRALGNGAYDEWYDYDNSVYGIYHTRAHGTTGNDVSLEVWGQFMYDDSKADGEEVTYTVSLNAIDDWGNESEYDPEGTMVMKKYNYRPQICAGLLDTEDKDGYGMPLQPLVDESGRIYVSVGHDGGELYDGYYMRDNNKRPIVVSDIRYNGYSVIQRSPQQTKVIDEYGTEKGYNLRCTPCYASILFEGWDKDYEFEITDLFGRTWKSTLDLDSLRYKDGLAIFTSEPTGITNENVTVTVSMNSVSGKDLNEDEVYNDPPEILSLKGYLEDGTEVTGEITGAFKSMGTIVMPQNGRVEVATHCDINDNYNTYKEDETFIQTLSVNNIDRVLEPLTLSYTSQLGRETLFTEDENGQLIRGEKPDSMAERIVVKVVCSEELYPVEEGEELEYVFPYDSKKGDTHTFKVKDVGGNTGTITATCPCDIADGELLPLSIEYYYRDGSRVPDSVSADSLSSNRVIIARVVCDEELILTDENGDDVAGGKTEYTYSYGAGKGEEHVFYVRDDAGNKGTVTAFCPCDIVRQEAAAVEYVYEDGSEITLSENAAAHRPIMARIVSMNGISESEAGQMYHIFDFGAVKGETATLYYLDADSNECEVEAVCPHDVVDDADRVGPSYTIKLIPVGRTETFEEISGSGSVSGDDVKAVKALKGYLLGEDGKTPFRARSFRIRVTGEDESEPVSIYIKKAGSQVTDAGTISSDSIDGVKASYEGSVLALDITQGAAFDLYLIDAESNLTSIKGLEIPGGCVLAQAPSMNIIAEDLSYDKAVMILLPDPDVPVTFDGDKVTAVTGGYIDEKGIRHENAYSAVFTENNTFRLTYRDEAGNEGFAQVTVSNIDKSAIVVRSVRWNGTYPTGKTPDKSDLVGREISAVLSTNKNIGEATLYVGDSQVSDNDIISVTGVGTTVTVRYRGNFEESVTVRIKSLTNGSETSRVLPAVTCIDMDAPVVEGSMNSETAEDKSYITLGFRTDEPAIVNEFIQRKNGKPEYSTQHSIRITDKSVESITLSDRQGNISEPISIGAYTRVIDREALKMEFSLLADHSDANAKIGDLGGKPAMGGTIYARPGKDAVIGIGQAGAEVAAGSWTALTLPADSTLAQIWAQDKNTGVIRYYTVATEAPDLIAPVVKLDKNTLVAYVGMPDEDIIRLVWNGVSASDDRDGEIDVNDIVLTGIPGSFGAGVYNLKYSATDKAGNTGSASRVLYIIEKGGFTAYLDDEAAMPGSIVILDGRSAKLRFDNPAMGDVLVRTTPGIKTVAQMKYASGFRTQEKEVELEMKSKGFSTVYVRNQERSEICFYVFVEEWLGEDE